MEEIQGIPIMQAPAGPERIQAARQLLESYYKQMIVDGFFHADPHPGNLMWWKDRVYFLDFGMVGGRGRTARASDAPADVPMAGRRRFPHRCHAHDDRRHRPQRLDVAGSRPRSGK